MSVQLLGPDGNPYVAKGIPVDATSSISGDATVASVIGGSNRAAMRDLDIYWLLVTKHPHVNACVTLISDAIASEGFDIAPADDEEGKPLSAAVDPRVADIRTFFGSAYAAPMTARGARRAMVIDVLGFGYTLTRKVRAGNTLVGLERLDPRTVQARLNDKRTAIDSYIVRPLNANGIVDPLSLQTVPARDVVLTALAGGDPVTGFSSPLEALDLTLGTDNSGRMFRRNAFEKAAFLGTVLANKNANKEAVEAAIAQIRAKKSGAPNAMDTLVLTGDWDLLKTAQTGKNDGDYLNATNLTREEVCGVYKVPLGMLTFSGGALGSAGKGDDRDFFEQFAVLPLEETIYEALTAALLKDEWGITDLALVPKRRNRVRLERFDAAIKLLKIGGTGNQALTFVGLPTSTYPGMDVPQFQGIANASGDGAEEPVDGSPAATSSDATDSAQGATDAHEVAQKGSKRFRGRREGY